MTARVLLKSGCVALDPIKGTNQTTNGVLVTFEGRTFGDTMNCALIPLGSIDEFVASVLLVAEQARKS